MHHASFPRIAFVDLETTGGMASVDRITEVGIVEVSAQGVQEWSSLVNPGVHIPDFITGLTGISDEMVANAPYFCDIAQEIEQRLEGCLFIAHNVRFDYGFLKNEFRRVDIDFRPPQLCTVKLSRRLFPWFGHHNLDALIERHRLNVTERHRALGDARLIWEFWQVIHRELPLADIEAVVRQLTALPSLPPHLDAGIVERLPTTHGVYFFYGENDLPLYIGKANHLRRRVLSHFSADHRSDKEMELSQQIRRIDWVETSGELGALLQEAHFVKKLVPVHNVALRKLEELFAWRIVERDGHAKVRLASSDDLFFDQDDSLYGLYANSRSARMALRALADANGLCVRVLGLEKGTPGKPCFARQVKKCHGACDGTLSPSDHTRLLRDAFAPSRLQGWPYAGPIAIRERKTLHVIDGWAYLGPAASPQEARQLLRGAPGGFDRDVYRILHPRLVDVKRRVIDLTRPD